MHYSSVVLMKQGHTGLLPTWSSCLLCRVIVFHFFSQMIVVNRPLTTIAYATYRNHAHDLSSLALKRTCSCDSIHAPCFLQAYLFGKVIMVMLTAGSPIAHLLLRDEVYEPAVALCPGPCMKLQACQLLHVPLKALQDLLLRCCLCLVPKEHTAAFQVIAVTD